MICVLTGPKQGRTQRYRCDCCSWESEHIDQFFGDQCGACAFGVNNRCKRCRSMGVLVRDGAERLRRSHMMRTATITWCGRRIPENRMYCGDRYKPCPTCFVLMEDK